MLKSPAGPLALVLVAALAVVAGCNISAPKSGQPASATPGATAPGATAPGATGADTNPSTVSARRVAATCGPEIAGAADVMAPGTIVMLGEMHGNAEMPAFAGNLACRAAVAGHAVIVGVEIPRAEQAAIDVYVAGEGSAADRRALLRGEHWQRSYQDGRSSMAMVELIERVRRLRKDGLKADVLAFDTGRYDDWNARDAGMGANVLEQVAASREAFVVTLSGNVHNRTAPGLPWDAKMVPMGVHVKAGPARVISLNGLYEGGSTWMCDPENRCGASDVGSRDLPYENLAIDISEAARGPGLDGVFFVPTLSASPPAVAPAAAAAAPAAQR